MKILVTGGTGYIGSHTVVELQKKGFDVIIVDALFNSRIEVLDSIEKITGIRPEFESFDLANQALTDDFFARHTDINAIIHFAAHKAVGESVEQPIKYYRNNLDSLMNILEAMCKYNVPNLVFSSSCTVYGQPDAEHLPVSETAPIKKAESPYGNTKQIAEEIISESINAYKGLNAIALRYFNPVGAHDSALIGELPLGVPNNLMPYITQVAVGKLEQLGVFGDDYDTPDGTGVRDYIHVVDLAVGHVKALKKIEEKAGLCIYNLGTGHGYSVLDIVKNFEAANDVKIPYVIKERRPGDIATCYCDPSKAEKELGWKAKYGIKEMCADSWRWQKNNPNGYDD